MKVFYLIFLISAYSTQLAAGTGVAFYGGYAQHRQDSMNDTKTYPSGMTYGAGYLMRKEFYEFEVFVKKGALNVDITHDNSKNTIEQEQLQLGLALNFFMTKKIFARLGYSFAKLDQKFQKPMSAASLAGAKKEYGLVEEKLVDGLNIGAGYVLLSGSKIDFLVQYDFFYYNKIKATQNSISLGIKYYFQ